jgi:hypothetical protein
MVGTVITLLVFVVPTLLVVGILARVTGASLPIRNGVQGEAIIKAYKDTGCTSAAPVTSARSTISSSR